MRKREAKEERKKEEEESMQVMVSVDVINTVMPVFLKEGFSTRQSIVAVPGYHWQLRPCPLCLRGKGG